jgi:hypothetical protein
MATPFQPKSSTLLYVVGALGLAGVGYLIFGGGSAQAAGPSPNPIDCATLIQGLPADVLKGAADAATHATGDPTGAVAAYLTAHNYPSVAACVKSDPSLIDLIKSIGPVGPGPVTPPPATRKAGCSPTDAQQTNYAKDMTLGDIAKYITGDANRFTELLALNKFDESNSYYEYVVTQQSINSTTGVVLDNYITVTNSRPITGADAYPFTPFVTNPHAYGLHSGGEATADGSGTWTGITNVVPYGIVVKSGHFVNIPQSWNQFFAWNTSTGHFDPDPAGGHTPCTV